MGTTEAPAALATVPRTVIDRVGIALGAIQRWNEALVRVRETEVLTHCPGRYEWEFRAGSLGQSLWQSVEQAHDTLRLFETVATAEEAAAVYESLGGKPEVLKEGPAVQEWRRPEA